MDIFEIISDLRITSLFIGIACPILLYWYLTRNFDYWRIRGIPFVKPYPIVGSMGEVFTKNLEVIEVDNYKKYGRIYGIFEGRQPLLMVAEPNILKNILVKDFQYFSTRRYIETGDPMFDKMLSAVSGEDWKRIRTIISPTFSTGKIKRLMSIFENCAKVVIEHMKSPENNTLDVLRIYGGYSMDVIASSAFSTKIDSRKDPDNEFVKHAKLAVTNSFGIKFLLFLIAPKLLKIFNISMFDSRSKEFFRRATLDVIEERKRTGQIINDFLQLLMDAANEVLKEDASDEKGDDITANYGDESINHAVFKTTFSKTLSMDELVAQCVIFLIAGYQTTATTIGVATYLLALNQDAQEKLFQEIKEVLDETDGKLTYEAVQKMKYLDNVISETLRLYTPLIRLDRTADVDYPLGDTGITVPKGMIIGIPNFAMHHDPEFFPDPEKFDPDRFSPEEREKQIPYTYLPFGAGPRNCIAMRFALIEMKICLIYVFSTFHAKKCSETKIPLEFGQAGGMIDPKSIVLHMVLRENCPLKF